MPSHGAAAADDMRPLHLKGKDFRWLCHLDALFPVQPPVPMRIVAKLRKLGLVELRADKLIITDKGRRILRFD
jgi:hypothetical protein